MLLIPEKLDRVTIKFFFKDHHLVPREFHPKKTEHFHGPKRPDDPRTEYEEHADAAPYLQLLRARHFEAINLYVDHKRYDDESERYECKFIFLHERPMNKFSTAVASAYADLTQDLQWRMRGYPGDTGTYRLKCSRHQPKK